MIQLPLPPEAETATSTDPHQRYRRYLHVIPRDVDRRLSQLLLKSAKILRRASAESLTETGTPWLEYLALARLEQRPGMTASTLARHTGVRRQTMQEIVLRLELANHVWRPDDRPKRERPVLLTEQGRTVLDRSHKRAAGVERYMLSELSHEDVGRLDTYLGSLVWQLTHGASYEFDYEMQLHAGWQRR